MSRPLMCCKAHPIGRLTRDVHHIIIILLIIIIKDIYIAQVRKSLRITHF